MKTKFHSGLLLAGYAFAFGIGLSLSVPVFAGTDDPRDDENKPCCGGCIINPQGFCDDPPPDGYYCNPGC